MNIAVLSDIHSNHIAFQECLNYLQNEKIDAFVFLGDYIGELAYPQKTMEMLRMIRGQYRSWFVKGNKEDYFLNYRKTGQPRWRDNDSTTGALMYSYSHLSQADLDFFDSLSIRRELRFDGLEPITICHGSPRRTNEKLLPDDENTFAIMDGNRNRVILCGHTHIQGEIRHNGKLVVNAGSVGVPLFSGGKAQFMILRSDDGRWEHEFVSIDYDRQSAISELRQSGLYTHAPGWTAVTEHLLRNGDVSHGKVLAIAMSLCRQDRGECSWPDIPETYWEQAVREMIGQK